MKSQQKDMLKRLLLYGTGGSRLWAALGALFIGNFLLLASVLIWWNFNELLYGKTQEDGAGSTYLVIGKKVTNTNVGLKDATLFSATDIDGLKQAPQVQEVGIISSNKFPVWAVLGGQLAMSTDLPLESVPDKFLDQKPADWNWQPGRRDVPIIMSTQFLGLYNYVFAPSQGLPQLSESSVKMIALRIKIGPEAVAETYSAHVVGFSDRINSVMAPQAFIDYGNDKFARQKTGGQPSQLILKVKDPSDKGFTNYLKEKDYSTNTENLRWSKIREIVEVVTTATGVLAVLLMGIGALVFILFIELTIARAHQSLVLLRELGYSPRRLSGFMLGRFVPFIGVVLVLGAVAVTVLQYVAMTMAQAKGLVLHAIPGMPVWLALGGSAVMLLLLVTRAIRGAIGR